MGGKLGGGELAGGDIDIGDAHPLLAPDQADQVVVALAVEQAGLDHRARGHQTDDLALHQAFGFAGFGHLLADGDLVATADEPRQVVVQSVIGDARHGHAMALAHISGGEDNLQLAGSQLGVFVKGLVEIAQAEEDNRLGVLSFDFEVLAADGG
ncbi:hypothetical protein ES703_80702 [subsurface metagenome]